MYITTLALAGLANAMSSDTPVLHVGDTGQAVAGIAQRAQLNPWELDPIRLSDLVREERGFLTIGIGQPAQCTSRKASMRDILERMEDARSHRDRQQPESARSDLQVARDMLGCLNEQAEPSTLAQLYALSGLVEIDLSRPQDASEHLRRALSFDPELKCSNSEPRSTCDTFEQTLRSLQEVPKGSVRVGLGVDANTVYVNGRRAAVQDELITLPAGRHLVQLVRDFEGSLVVSSREIIVSEGGEVMLANTSEISDTVLRTPDDPRHRELLGALLRTSFPDQPMVYLWTGEQGWLLNSNELTKLNDPPADRSALRRSLLVGGGTAAGIGLATGVIGLALVATSQEEDRAAELEETIDINARNKAGIWALAQGSILTGLGLAVAGGAFVLGDGPAPMPVQLSVTPVREGGQVTLSVRR